MASKIATFAARVAATGAIGVMLLSGAATAAAGTSTPAARASIGADYGHQHCTYQEGYWQRVYQRGYWDRDHRWQPAHWTRVWHPAHWNCEHNDNGNWGHRGR